MKHSLMVVALVLSALAARAASAQTPVYVHGWLPDGNNLSPHNNSRWSPYPWGSTLPGAVFVGWNTKENWRGSGVDNTVAVFNARCLRSAGQSCTVICHSTGCAVTGAVLDIHGTTGGIPRWNINRVLALASAEGGTELGSLAGLNSAVDAMMSVFGYSGPVTDSLRYLTPSYVRGAYDHHDTAGTAFFHVAGYDGGWGSALLPGQDDGAVPYHSACGYVKVFSATQCSNDWEWAKKCSWYGCVPVMRTVGQWTNHRRVEYCGRDGCNKRHMQLVDRQFQDLATVANP